MKNLKYAFFTTIKPTGYNDRVTSVPKHLHSSLLPLGFMSGALVFFDLFKFKTLRVIPNAHKNAISTLSILPDGSVLSGSNDGVLKQWKYGKCIYNLVFNRPGNIYRVISSHDSVLVFYDTSDCFQLSRLSLTDKEWKPLYKFKHLNQVRHATILNEPNGELIFSDGNKIKRLDTKSAGLTIWDLPSKLPLLCYDNYNSFGANSDQGIVAAGNSKGLLRLRDTKQNQWKILSDDSSDTSFALGQLAFLSNDVLISISRATSPTNKTKTLIKFWDLNTNTCIHILQSSEHIDHLRVLPNGILLTIAANNNIRIWDVSYLKLECKKTTDLNQNHCPILA